jgi:hypothetical protein
MKEQFSPAIKNYGALVKMFALRFCSTYNTSYFSEAK